ncbi:MAG: hypothetical protein KJO29_06945 [Bacteroidia bacterium]|nr:hypothetical protein [Bacteroidia bacterium]
MKYGLLILIYLAFSIEGFSQDSMSAHAHSEDHESHDMPKFRAAVLIAHTLIPDEHTEENFLIPSWGFDLEYWFNRKWGIGLHNDLEIETFIISGPDGEEGHLERVYPLVLTFDGLYKVWKDLVVQLGVGTEIERQESYFIYRVGLEYEFEMGNHWDIAPTFFYDSRLSEYHTWSLALGIGKRF